MNPFEPPALDAHGQAADMSVPPRTEPDPPAEPPEVRTPATDVPAPGPDETGAHDLGDPAYLLNRELTWLNFNFRVLHEGGSTRSHATAWTA